MFYHHEANKAVAVAAGKKLVFPLAKLEHKKCVTLALMTRASMSALITQLFFFFSFLCLVFQFLIFLLRWLIGISCCSIKALATSFSFVLPFLLPFLILCNSAHSKPYSIPEFVFSHYYLLEYHLLEAQMLASCHQPCQDNTLCQAWHLVGCLDPCTWTGAAADSLIYLFTMYLLLA